jgi:hypothetical protein
MFEDASHAAVFYFFVFVLPDSVPAVCTLLILLRGHLAKTKEQQDKSGTSEAEVPLLEAEHKAMNDARKRYQV